MTNTLETLAARCEAATGPDRELDGVIDRLLRTRPSDGDYNEAENCLWQVDEFSGLCVRGDGFARASFCAPLFTESLDAAMTLVPEGCCVDLRRFDSGGGFAQVRSTDATPDDADDELYVESEHCSTAALALCAAALRARAQKKDEPDADS